MRTRTLTYLLTAGLLASGAAYAATSGTTTLQITVALPAGGVPPLVVTATPSNPTLACEAVAGTVVSKITTTGGDSNPVILALAPGTSDPSFVLSGTTAPANVIVGTSGIRAADCTGNPSPFAISFSQQ